MVDEPPKPTVPPLQRHLQLETDFFCFQCGYNLHGQIVTRDERLDILVCRCPECGRFHPAAQGVSATRPWLARVGVMLITVWSIWTLAFLALTGFFIGFGPYAHLESYTVGNYTTDGVVHRILRDASLHNGYYAARQENNWRIFAMISGIAALAAGMYLAVAFWHVRRATLRRFVLFPVVVALFVWWIWWGNYDIDEVFGWSLSRLGMYTLWSIFCLMLGVKIGRPVARYALRLIVPVRFLQVVGFLWQCDGKDLPKAAP